MNLQDFDWTAAFIICYVVLLALAQAALTERHWAKHYKHEESVRSCERRLSWVCSLGVVVILAHLFWRFGP